MQGALEQDGQRSLVTVSMSGRISLAVYEEGRHLDRIHAKAFLDGHREADLQLADIRTNLQQASRISKEVAQGQKMLNTVVNAMGMKVDAAAESVKHLTQWHKRQTDALEVLPGYQHV